MSERDRTAMTGPLTIGQQIVARWEGPSSEWSEPADLAEAIDAAILATQEKCAQVADMYGVYLESYPDARSEEYYTSGVNDASDAIASAIRALKMETGHE